MTASIDQLSSLFHQLKRMSKEAATPESHKVPTLLSLVDPIVFLESSAAALCTKAPFELSWDNVATTLIDEYNARESGIFPSSSSANGRSRINHWNKRWKNAIKTISMTMTGHFTSWKLT